MNTDPSLSTTRLERGRLQRINHGEGMHVLNLEGSLWLTQHCIEPTEAMMSYTIERYPTRLIDVWTLRNGRRVTVRPVLPQDAELEQALVRALSPASRYQRFFAPIRELPQDWFQRLTQIDYRLHQALIVESFDGEEALAVAEALCRRRHGQGLRICHRRRRRLAATGPGAAVAGRAGAGCGRGRSAADGGRRTGHEPCDAVAGTNPGIPHGAPPRRRCAGGARAARVAGHAGAA